MTRSGLVRALALLLGLAGLAVPGAAGAGREVHADPVAGSDEGPGDAARPWRTLKHTLPRLRAGDTLWLHAGTFFEAGLEVAQAGTPEAPIALRASPGARVAVDGGYREFREPGPDTWEPVGAAPGLYRSRQRYPGAKRVHGSLEREGALLRLVPYERYADLVSANERYRGPEAPLYVGHGVHWNATDARIYLRLEPGELQRKLGFAEPGRIDPRVTPLALYPDGAVLRFASGASHWVVEGVDLRHRNFAIEVESGAHHLRVARAELRGGRTHVMIREGAHHLVFEDLTIRDGVPDWIAWEDVKKPPRPAHDLQGVAFALKGDAHHVEISRSRILNLFDGIDATQNAHHLDVHDNLFQGIRDDCLQLGTAGHDYHVHHNRMLGVSKGVSRNGSGESPAPGTTWIHHNVIDASGLMQYGRQEPDGRWHGKAEPGQEGRVWANPFGSHSGEGYGAGDAWKIYHNTVLLGRDLNGRGAGHTRQRRPGLVHEVYNNLFVQTQDHWIAHEAVLEGGLQIYDGNLYFRPVRGPRHPLFRQFLLGAGAAPRDYATLAAWRASPAFEATRASYPPGWESSGVEADPRLDADYRPHPEGPAASGAVPLPAGLPGDDGARYRGALPPAPRPGGAGP